MSDSRTFDASTLLGEKAELLRAAPLVEQPIIFHGDLDRLAAITEIPQLRSASHALEAWNGQLKMARAWSPPGVSSFEIFPTREQLRPLYDAGCTIVLEGVETFVPALVPLCRSLERDLGVAPGKIAVQVFAARRGGGGRAHFDAEFNFNCQITGTKRWRMAPNTLRFPPSGMFLGRLPDQEVAALLSGPLPTSIEGGDELIAEPGTVVFLPPGVLHETHMDTESYAVVFTIQDLDTVAGRVRDRVYARLQRIPELRAGRLGGQSRGLGVEVGMVVQALRQAADELEASGERWWSPEVRIRIRPGLVAEAVSETAVSLRGESAHRVVTLDAAMVSILVLASPRGSLGTADLARLLPTVAPAQIDEAIRKLLHIGLMEVAA